MTRPIVIAAAAVLLAACGGGSTASRSAAKPATTATPGLYQVGQTVHGPAGVTLKVLGDAFDPPGNCFSRDVAARGSGGRWVLVQMTMHNGGAKPYAVGDLFAQSMVLDFQVHDQAGGSIAPSGIQHDSVPQIGGPILPGETASGWMSFAVPASGWLRLIWVPAGAEVQLPS